MTQLKDLSNNFTPELLLFCWKDLKHSYKMKRNFYFREFCVSAISLRWFLKVSSLIRSGKLDYSKYLESYKFSRRSLRNFKYLVLQKAFIIVLKPFFSKYLKAYNFTLTDCLRVVFHRVKVSLLFNKEIAGLKILYIT